MPKAISLQEQFVNIRTYEMLLHFLLSNCTRKYYSTCIYTRLYLSGYILLIICLLPHVSFCQGSNLITERIFLREGLSQSIVNCIAQDNAGFMYFGTENGLNRFDGYSFKIMRNNPGDKNSLSNNKISAICVDEKGSIWIGTINSGLNKFNPYTNKITQFNFDRDNPNSISHNNINALCQGKSGVIWVGSDNGINKVTPIGFDGDKYLVERICHSNFNNTSLSNDTVYSFLLDSYSNLWVGTANGLNLLTKNMIDSKGIKFRHFSIDNNRILSHNVIRAIFEDKEGVLWIGTNKGLNALIKNNKGDIIGFKKYCNDPRDKNSLSHNTIYAICEDNYGRLWIGTYGGGINILNKERNSFTRYMYDPLDSRTLGCNEITSIFKDRSGVMWVGTYGNGINKIARISGDFTLYSSKPGVHNSLNNPYIWSIYEDKEGMLWIGTNGGGLNKLNRKNNTYSYFQHNPDNNNSLCGDIVRVIFEDSDGKLWIGTHGAGISIFNRGKNTFTNYAHDPNNSNSLAFDKIRCIYEDRSRTIWIGTYGQGLDKYIKETRTFKHYRNESGNHQSLSNNLVRVIYEDKAGVLWIGTDGGGLNKFNRSSETFQRFVADLNNPAALNCDYIFCIHESPSGILWLGTWGGGLNRFDTKTNKVECFTTRDGLPNNFIYGILEDKKGNLWLSTNFGISKFNPKTRSFSSYTMRDGLQDNEFNAGGYFKSSSGEMFLCGIKGFNSFYPENIHDNKFIPPIVITAFQKFNKEINLKEPFYSQKQIDLSHKDYVFSFEFASLDFSAPEKNKYAYKMEGLDEDWIYTSASNRTVTYTTLAPGEYIFKVKGTNSDGIWNEKGTYLKVIVHPPFWGTLWFRGLVLILVILSAYFLYRKRVKSIEEKKNAILERLEEKTKLSEELQNALTEVESLTKRLEAENIYLQDEIRLQHNFENIITCSDKVKKVLHKVEQVASSNTTVLILGETGTGKELLARAIHNISNRSERPLVKVNCSALPANLIESELFGHEKGAFTGAIARKAGRFELADGGTIFLDEIGDLPIDLQPKILRVLQEGEFERIGSCKTIDVDIRIIAATNRNLVQAIKEGTFREDLYYRLNVFPIILPPLRDRKEDIPILVYYFVNKFCRKAGKKIDNISQEMINQMNEYCWPGNVRELENVIERAVITTEGSKLLLGEVLHKSGNTPNAEFEYFTLEEIERNHIIKTLEKTNWLVSGERGAAKILGIKRTTLEARMKKLNITKK